MELASNLNYIPIGRSLFYFLFLFNKVRKILQTELTVQVSSVFIYETIPYVVYAAY